MRITVNILKDTTLVSHQVRQETKRIVKQTGCTHNKAFHQAKKNISDVDHVCVVNTMYNDVNPKAIGENIAAGRPHTVIV